MNKRRNLTHRTLKHLCLCIAMIAAWGCSREQATEPEMGVDGNEREVIFSAGRSGINVRAPFIPGTPVKIYVYRHATPEGIDFSATPYKVAGGVTTTGSGKLSDVEFTDGDITTSGKLTVRSGSIYSFVVLVSAAYGATKADIPEPVEGVISGLTHGRDILAGFTSMYVTYSTEPVSLTFTGYGADEDGNLPHLGCAVTVEARAAESLLNGIAGFTLSLTGIDFIECMPGYASLSFDRIGQENLLELADDGFNTTYRADLVCESGMIDKPGDVVVASDIYILPYPLRNAGVNYNLLDINFRFEANGKEMLIEAKAVQVPEFKEGYRYKFILVIDEEFHINAETQIVLEVENWNRKKLEDDMGEEFSGRTTFRIHN